MLFFLNRINIKMYIYTHTYRLTMLFLGEINHIYTNSFTKLPWHLFAFHWLLRSQRCFLYHFSYRYLEAYCAVFPSNSILIYDFIRRAWIYSVCPDVSFKWQKRGKKKRNWKWNWWEVFPTGKFFRSCSCGNWRYRDAVANFVLPHLADR